MSYKITKKTSVSIGLAISAAGLYASLSSTLSETSKATQVNSAEIMEIRRIYREDALRQRERDEIMMNKINLIYNKVSNIEGKLSTFRKGE